jgi:hypothetical protein
MRKIIAFLLISLLPGCAMLERYMPAKPKFPDAIKELQQPCPELKQIEGNQVAITELLKAVVNNYSLYYDCSMKNEGWNKWYKEQKDIYEKGGKK